VRGEPTVLFRVVTERGPSLSWLVKVPSSAVERVWFLRLLSTTIGKKFVMAITGLLLCGFIVFHFAGNALMLVGPEAYNRYAHALHSQEWLIKIAEAGLLVLFLLHILLAISTSLDNSAARRVSYEEKESKLAARTLIIPAENWMFATGAIVLGFLIWHISDFALETSPFVDYEGKEPFDKAIAVLQTPVSFWVYLLGVLALAIHLLHGFQSALQSLGVNHPKYNVLLRGLGTLVLVLVALGFAIFPLWAFLK
jgi:succinate dehydrogenase / fumarate reductase cytochrome b subunit